MTSTIDEIRDLLNQPERFAQEAPRLRAMAAQPSVSLGVLKAMLPLCATEVLQNPAFRLAMATDSTLISHLSLRGQAAIAGCEVADPGLIRRLGARRTRPLQCRVAAAGNPACPTDMLWDFLKHRCPVRASLARNLALPGALIEALCQDDMWKVRDQVALRPTLSEALFGQLAADSDWHVRKSLAVNPSLPEPIKDALVYDPYYRVREALAARQDLGEDRLAVMADREKGPTVLCVVILNPCTALSALEKHHSTRDYGVQDALAEAYRRQQGSPGEHYRAYLRHQ